MKPHHRGLDYTLLLGALVLGCLAEWILRLPEASQTNAPWGWILLVFAAGLGGAALLRMDTWLPEASALPTPAHPQPANRRKMGWLCLAAAGLAAAYTAASLVAVQRAGDTFQWAGALIPWLGSLALMAASGRLLGSTQNGQSSMPHPANAQHFRHDFPLPLRVEVVGFLVITALAIFLRTYRLDTFPLGIYVDETNAAMDALYILEGRPASPFGTGWYGTPNGYIYFMAVMIKVFGANFYTLKAISLLPALLTVLAIYPLGRMLFGPVGGLSAMLFMAVSRWHLSMSRFGWNETAVPLFQILATWFLLRGLRERRASDFIAGGLISGLMMYIYLSSRLAIATLALFVLYWVLSDPDGPRESLKRSLVGVLLFGFAALVTFAPLAVTYAADPFAFNNRVSEISIARDITAAHSLQPLWSNIKDHLRFFHQRGDLQGKHNLPGEPETDPLTGLLFVIGLAYALVRLRDRRRGLLVLWLLLGMAGGILSSQHESPQAYRSLTALPAVALLAGDTASRIFRGALRLRAGSVSTRFQSRALRVLQPVGVGLFFFALLGAALWESNVFLNRQMASPAVKQGFNPTENAVANEVLAALKNDQPIYLSPKFHEFSPLRFLVYGYMKQTTGQNTLDQPPYRLARPENLLPIPDSGKDVVFLLDPDYASVAPYFQAFYPHMQGQLVQMADAPPLFMRVKIPRADLAAIQGLNVRLTYPNGLIKTGTTPTLGGDLLAAAATASTDAGAPGLADPLEIEWSGSLRVENSGVYDFPAENQAQVTVDDQGWSGSRFLCSGLHTIRVTRSYSPGTGQEDTAGALPFRWIPPGGQAAEIPPQNWFRIAPPRQGLAGAYYQGDGWQGEPVCNQPTPFLLMAWPDQDPIPGAFSAKFTGFLNVTQPGDYRLMIQADDGARLTLDGRVVAEGMNPNQFNQFETTVQLTAGRHPIQIDYFQAGGGSALIFKWQVPGSNQAAVPMAELLPPLP